MKSCGGRPRLRRREPFGVQALTLLLTLAGAACHRCAAHPRTQLPKFTGTAVPIFCLFRAMIALPRCPGTRPHRAERGVLTIIDTRPPSVGRTDIFQVAVARTRAGASQWTVWSKNLRVVFRLERNRRGVLVGNAAFNNVTMGLKFNGLKLSPHSRGAPAKISLSVANAFRSRLVPPKAPRAKRAAPMGHRPPHRVNMKSKRPVGRRHLRGAVCVLLGRGRRELFFARRPYEFIVSLWPNPHARHFTRPVKAMGPAGHP